MEVIKRAQKKAIVKYVDEEVVLPEEISREVYDNFKLYENKFTDGTIYSIKDYNEDEDSIKINVIKDKYSHFLYTKYKRPNLEYRCENTWSGAVIETKDNKYILGKQSHMSEKDGMITITAGSTDLSDIIGDDVDFEKTFVREMYEEFGIDASNKDIVDNYYLKYFKIPCESEEWSFGFIYKVKLNITFDEFYEMFHKYKNYLEENKLEVEFDEVYGIYKNREYILDYEKKDGIRLIPFYEELLLKELEN